MKIKFADLKTINKLIQESSEDFLSKPKEPGFFERNKTNLGIGAAGLLGAAGLGYLGHDLGNQYGDSAHTKDIMDIENSKSLQQSQLENLQASKQSLENFDPKAGLTIDEHLIRTDGVDKIMADIEAEKDRALAEVKAKFGANTIEGAKATTRILDNYNANKTALQDALHSNTKFLGDFRSGGEVKDIIGSNNVPESSFFSRLFSNDDLSNPSEANLQNRARIDDIIKKATAVSELNDNIDPQDIVKYNTNQLPIVKEKLNHDMEGINKAIQKTDNTLTRLKTPEAEQQYLNKYSNIGTGIGSVSGGGLAAVGAAKLAAAHKEAKEAKEREDENNLNSYGEALPDTSNTQAPSQHQQQNSLIGIR